MASVLHPDPFNATLLSSPPPFLVSDEQRTYIRKVLDICCSDSQFSSKAYVAISHILTSGPIIPPAINSLTPNSAEIGDPSFTLHVHGTGFKNTSVIVFAGQIEPTTFVSATELTTGVNMAVWLGPDSLPVSVITDDVESNSMSFTFTDGTVQTASFTASKTEKVLNKDKK